MAVLLQIACFFFRLFSVLGRFIFSRRELFVFPKKNINNNHDFSAENYSMFLYELLPNDIKAIFNYVQ